MAVQFIGWGGNSSGIQEGHLQACAMADLNPRQGRQGLTVSLSYVSIILTCKFPRLFFQLSVPLLKLSILNLRGHKCPFFFQVLSSFFIIFWNSHSISQQSSLGKISSSHFLPVLIPGKIWLCPSDSASMPILTHSCCLFSYFPAFYTVEKIFWWRPRVIVSWSFSS